MFGVNEGSDPAVFLRLCDNVESKCCFTTRFRSENFDDAATWNALTTQCQVKRKTACRNAFDTHIVFNAKWHDRALSERFFNLL